MLLPRGNLSTEILRVAYVIGAGGGVKPFTSHSRLFTSRIGRMGSIRFGITDDCQGNPMVKF